MRGVRPGDGARSPFLVSMERVDGLDFGDGGGLDGLSSRPSTSSPKDTPLLWDLEEEEGGGETLSF